MGPAELPPWQPLVGAVAVANQDTRKITAQQGTHAVAIAVVADQEDGQVSRNADPQPSLARLLFPGSLVSMNHGRLAELRVGFGNGPGNGGADLLFATRDCSQRDRHVERRTQEFFRLPFTEMITTGAQAKEGLQAWSKGALRDAVGKLATRGEAAV